MPEIKFSHNYKKLRNRFGKAVKQAKLLHVFPINLSEMREDFRKYDADGIFSLGETGSFIVLLFLKKDGSPFPNVFTTIRRATVDKMVYYEKNVGVVFDLILTE